MVGSGQQTLPGSSVLSCPACQITLPELTVTDRCPECQDLLELKHDLHGLDPVQLKELWALRRGAVSLPDSSGVWRFRELVMPSLSQSDRIITYPEGNTPLLRNDSLAAWTGAGWLRLKHEGMNPTGSFKDRGMTVAVTNAARVEARAVACASTGNTAASLASYGAQAGLATLVVLPHGGVELGKLHQAIAYGAKILEVAGDFDRCLELLAQAARELPIYLANSINPFRLEGQKTIVWELLDQLDWAAPDWLVVPAGNLGNTAAFGKALREASQLGLIDRIPKVVAVQASGAAPFVQGFQEGFTVRHKVTAQTQASAIRIGAPASWNRAVRTINETSGLAIAVTDAMIIAAKAQLDRNGIGAELASATTIAGIRLLRESNIIADGDRVVAVLTGHILKDSHAVKAVKPQGNVIADEAAALNRAIEDLLD